MHLELQAGLGDKPIARLTRAHVEETKIARAAKPEAANHVLKMLRVLLNYAVFRGWREAVSPRWRRLSRLDRG